MPRAQPRMAKAVFVVARGGEPAAKGTEKLVARAFERRRMQRADAREIGLEVHQVVKAVDEFAHARFAAYEFERGRLRERGVVGIGHTEKSQFIETKKAKNRSMQGANERRSRMSRHCAMASTHRTLPSVIARRLSNVGCRTSRATHRA